MFIHQLDRDNCRQKNRQHTYRESTVGSLPTLYRTSRLRHLSSLQWCWLRGHNIWCYTAQHMTRSVGILGTTSTIKATQDACGASWRVSGRDPSPIDWQWGKSGEPDTSATRHFGITKLVPKFQTNHRWSCVSSELSWVKVSWLFLDHGTRVEVSRTTFLVSKCLETGAEVSQSVWCRSVLWPKCPVTARHTRVNCDDRIASRPSIWRYIMCRILRLFWPTLYTSLFIRNSDRHTR